MARYMRQYGKSHLEPPSVVGAGIAWHGPGTYLTYPTVGFRNRKQSHYQLRPPAVVLQPQIFFGPKVNLNVMLPERLRGTVTRRRPTYALNPPAVIGPGIYYRGIQQHGALEPRKNYQRRDVQAVLRPPAVVNQPGIFSGPKVYLNVMLPERARGTVTRRRPTYVLGPPIVLQTNLPTKVTLVRIRPRRTLSELRPPTVVFLAVEIYGPVVALAKNEPQPTTTFLRGLPTGASDVYTGPKSHLAYQSRRSSHSHLPQFIPTTVTQVFNGPQTHLVRGLRPVAKSALRPPAILASTGPSQYMLAYSRRGIPRSFLRPPTDTIGLEDQGRVQIHLAASKRGQPKSRLEPPAVVSQPPAYQQVLPPALAYSRRGAPRSRLQPPTVVFPFLARPLDITLAPQRRGTPKPELRPPVVVFLAVEIYGPVVSLARIKHPPVQHVLRAPTDTVGLEDQGRVSVHLAYSRRGQPKSFLNPFSERAFEVFSGPEAHLTYSRRGRPLSFLRPEPIGAFDIYYGPQVTLVRIKPPKTAAELKPPAVVGAIVYYGPSVNLTYSRRGAPKSHLAPPTVIAQPAFQAIVPPTFAPQRRGRPVYRLRPPTVVFPFFARAIDVTFTRQHVTRTTYVLRPPRVLRLQEFDLSLRRISKHLAYSRRGRPIYEIRPPQVVRLAVEIYGPVVRLAPSRFPKPKSFLLPPEVVGRRPFRGILVHLAPSRFPKPKSRLFPPVIPPLARPVDVTFAAKIAPRSTFAVLRAPAVVRVPFFGSVSTQLARIKPQPTTAFLRPPAVVRIPVFGRVNVHLSRIKHPPVQSVLFPPSVIGAPERFYGPAVHLTRIRPPGVIHALRVTLVAFTPPRGDVCGFDIAGSFVCELQLPGSVVSGSDSTGSAVSGTSRAATNITGSDSEGGSVSGSDRKAT